MMNLMLGLTMLAGLIWVGLLTLWGQFWRADQRLDVQGALPLQTWPPVTVVIPARNEAALIGRAIRSHLTQSYPGALAVVLVDDQSTDKTAAIATQTAIDLGQSERLTVLPGSALPAGWAGKLWALDQGFRHLLQQPEQPDYVLFTDADIEHDVTSVQQLVTQAEANQLDLVSLMVQLRCQSFWERLLIPAFVFFFQMLYPFPWVNNPAKKTAAAAGGCALIRFSALGRIDGLRKIRDALIDDCALGAAVKAGGPIWLGLSTTIRSLRPYPDLASIWNMVTRSAYTQLNYSPWLLVGTVLGMVLVYLVSPITMVWGWVEGQPTLVLAGMVGWLLMAIAYWPTVRLYGGNLLWALTLPFIAVLYTMMTVDSARRHWQGRGGAWKGRVYK
ncbi:MAG: glycosyltransferase [Cyanobacteria bacterium]|nr:glycosyltransferase [Cyanobacteriota bacterium]